MAEGANGLLRAEEWTALHIKESVWLGHGWPVIGNSLKWRTISYPVIWCDSPCNSTLSRCTSPIYIPNHSKFAFYHYGSSERGAMRCAHEETTQMSGFRCLAHYHSAFPSPFTSTSLFHPHTETLPALLSTLELISPGPFLRKPNFTKTDPSSLKKKDRWGCEEGTQCIFIRMISKLCYVKAKCRIERFCVQNWDIYSWMYLLVNA